MKGTPKTLDEAIQNAIDSLKDKSSVVAAEVIRAHVIDFLAQKFSVAFMKNDSDVIRDLWKMIKK